MSLPTKAKFYYKGKEVARCSCNIGWVYKPEYIPKLFKEMAANDDWWEYEDGYKHWDEVELYGETYTKEDVRRMLNVRNNDNG
jgi:hypothetical protein